ncbi:VgrG protein [Minicystis rosea]|nr:VgrG protein [Minicystis rosea]
MTTSSLPPYQLAIDGFPRGHFRVHSLTGKETISEAYSFEIVVTCEPGGDEVERTALGQRAVLLFSVGEAQRAFYGVIASVRLTQVHAVDRTVKYHVRLVPRLWLLKRKKRTRIFQNMRVTDIVSAVLAEAGIATRWQLTRAYPMREYCTQYEETDYRFVKRLLAEAGIYFYFPEGPPVDDAALTADAAIGAVAAAGSTVLDAMDASAVGSIVGQVASIAETLIPGDTVICADDASCYPPMNGDDAAALAASTAAALAPAVGDLFGAGDGIAGAAIGTASAVAGTVIAAVTEGSRDVPVLHFLTNEDARVSVLDKVTRFSLRNTVRSTGAVFRDYDPDRPMVRLQSSAVSTQPFPPSPFEQAAAALAAAENVASVAQSLVPLPSAASGAIAAFESVAETADAAVNAVAGALGQKVPHEVYEHHSPFLFPKWGFANEEAPRILRQKRRRASVATGEGGCSDLSPGHRFALHDHPAPQLDSTYVVVSVEHHGETRPESGGIWRVYRNTFECAPAEMPYPPPRPKRKSVQVSLTATVVGPPGEEIHVDEKGQIKVQFHWDREGKYDDKSSCWIRVMQPWAGASWGHQFIPRVGMEVVVVFEGGDPDKPMVLGALYNGSHPPAFKLPEKKTRSGIRTSSYPGGHGHNELSFEDLAGQELVYVHAQRDLEEHVVRSRSVHVGGSESTNVHGVASARVAGDRLVEVGGGRKVTVEHEDQLDVKGRMERHVGGALRATVAHETEVKLSGGLSMSIGGTHAVHVGGEHAAQSDYFVEGSHSLGAKERIIVRAEQGITLACGKATIELLPDKLVLKAPAIELLAEETLECASNKGPSMSLGDKAEILTKKFALFTENAALELDTEVKTKGNAIKLGYDPSKPSKVDKDQKSETKPFKVKLSNYFLTPYKNKKFHVLVEGQRIEGETDGDGFVSCDVPASARALQIRLWLSDYPQGPRREYTVDLEDLKPATSVAGAKERLKNLGYYRGRIDEVQDDEFAAALGEFQDDHKDTHGLEVTSDADQSTLAALADVHGS